MKFKKGDIVQINPNATREDFEKNGCATKFVNKKGQELIIGSASENGKNEPTYQIQNWWILERCLIPYKEENEI